MMGKYVLIAVFYFWYVSHITIVFYETPTTKSKNRYLK